MNTRAEPAPTHAPVLLCPWCPARADVPVLTAWARLRSELRSGTAPSIKTGLAGAPPRSPGQPLQADHRANSPYPKRGGLLQELETLPVARPCAASSIGGSVGLKEVDHSPPHVQGCDRRHASRMTKLLPESDLGSHCEKCGTSRRVSPPSGPTILPQPPLAVARVSSNM
jgi:hypothetical protein